MLNKKVYDATYRIYDSARWPQQMISSGTLYVICHYQRVESYYWYTFIHNMIPRAGHNK
jgi:hypothetical protein